MTISPLKPIGPVGQPVSGNIEDWPPVVLGGATFSRQYNDDPAKLGVQSIIRSAFQLGIRAIDTSPYYGNSEIYIGQALAELQNEFPRETYYLLTKVGRIGLDEFNYSAQWVIKSVNRSLARLHTDYLDTVYLHDIEFRQEDEILEALKQLRQLKDQGKIHYFGLLGYPVPFLYYMAQKVAGIPDIGSLDAVMSYCHYNIHNTVLEQYATYFKRDARVKMLQNASILSMSLLRSAPTRPFHPASSELKAAVKKAAEVLLNEDDEELAELATRFAFRGWASQGPTVIGVSSVEELRSAIEQYWRTVDNHKERNRDELLVAKFRHLIGDEHIDESWPSGIAHDVSKVALQ